jgi:hypothetical protein
MDLYSQFLNWLTQNSISQAAATIIASIATLTIGFLTTITALVIGLRQGSAAKVAARAAAKNAQAALLSTRLAGHREIAKLRIQWMETLRNTLAEYHAVLMTWDEERDAVEGKKPMERLVLLGTQIDLLLNQDNDAQKKLWDVAERIYHLPTSEAQKEDKALVEAARNVLKLEWERVKSEMRDGDIRKGSFSSFISRFFWWRRSKGLTW